MVSCPGRASLAGVWGEGGGGKQADVSGVSVTRAWSKTLGV